MEGKTTTVFSIVWTPIDFTAIFAWTGSRVTPETTFSFMALIIITVRSNVKL